MTKYPDARSDSSRPVESFYRLFMVPGMGHCGGGAGPNRFDSFSALENWVEKAIAPEQLIGAGTVPGDPAKMMTRPLCVYPQVAQYKGPGDPNNAANFVCVAPQQRR